MKLGELLSAIDQKEVWGATDIDIQEIVFDSRQAKPGALFIAIPGTQRDGHLFVSDAIARGAAAVLVERKLALSPDVTQVVVPEARKALALVSAAFYGFPGRKLRVIGVTGTDGKTTTCTLIGSILEAAGRRTGLITTVNARVGNRLIDTGFHTTTPDPPDVQRYLAEMVADGAEYVVLETTSHGLAQHRTLGAEYDVAVITNVTHEHLDYHRTYDEYLAAKGRLFEQLATSTRKPSTPKVSVTNIDDASYRYLKQFPADVKLTYGICSPADVTAEGISLSGKGIHFTAVTPQGRFEAQSSLLGTFNVYNILAAIAVGVSQGFSFSDIQMGIQAVKGIAGRMESIDCGQDFSVIVDFAHTPGSLEHVLELARTLTDRRVIVVFGCAGLRDREKRPLMGEVAGRLADVTVVTAEDPRTERLEAIIDQIASGLEKAGRREGIDYFKIGDRAQAIEFGVSTAQTGDLVIITGKGHERSMCFGETEYPWSDQDAARKALGCK
ncbi:MAG: UDP-N-acetylmuramoyl-L-alanyl-D-glutamate--2,6-diaminopimelate ligase [Chloroflexi bacterium]|nr:UDP-N-acetylmuramoyl-L-alanyl-D-glutamate--2,6-diaminopimelate ligase [Chloroflexota bacterium]